MIQGTFQSVIGYIEWNTDFLSNYTDIRDETKNIFFPED
jgi:hypothetical protein